MGACPVMSFPVRSYRAERARLARRTGTAAWPVRWRLASHSCNHRVSYRVFRGKGVCPEGGLGDEEAINPIPGAVVYRAGACCVRGDGCRDAGLLSVTCSAHGKARASQSLHLLAHARIPDVAVTLTREREAPEDKKGSCGAAATAPRQIAARAVGRCDGPETQGR